MEAARHSPDAPTEPDPCFARYPVDIEPAVPKTTGTGRATPLQAGSPGRRILELRRFVADIASQVIGR